MAKQKYQAKPSGSVPSGGVPLGDATPKKAFVQQATNQQITTQIADNQPFSFDKKFVPAILALLIFVSYIPVWQNEFVWDDKPYIMINDLVKNFDPKGIFTEFVVGN